MARGGKRHGAGRKKGNNALAAEKARALIVKELDIEFKPIVKKAVEQAKNGDFKAREWLTERGYGKVPQAITPLDDDGKVIPIIGINFVPIKND